MSPLLSSCSVERGCPCPLTLGKNMGHRLTTRVPTACPWLKVRRKLKTGWIDSSRSLNYRVARPGWCEYKAAADLLTRQGQSENETAQRQRRPRYGGSQTWYCWALAPAASDSDPSTDLRRIRTNTFSAMLQRTWVRCLSLATKSLANTNYFLMKRKIVRGYKMEPLTKF